MTTGSLDPLDPPAPRRTGRLARLGAALRRGLWLDTLKGQIAVGSVLALVAGIGLTAAFMSRVAERELLELAQHREHVEAARTAAVIGRRVGEMQRALRVTVDTLDPALLRSPQALQEFFEARSLLRSLFANIAVVGSDGRMLLYHDAAGPRHPDINVADRAYFRKTLDERRAVVSDPLPGRVSDEPVIAFTQPIIDPEGRLHGVVVGAMRLASRDLLEDLAETRDDDRDNRVVITDADGRILAHPQRAMLTRPLSAEPRLAAAFERWVAVGRPLMRDAGAWSDEREVVAMAGEPLTGWHVWRVGSAAGMTAPLRGAQRQASLPAAGLVLALLVLMLLHLARQLRPLQALELRAAALMRGEDDAPWPVATGEIGELARTLRHVWAERSQAEAFNTEVLRKLSSVMAASPVGLAFTRNRRYELVSTEMCRMMGRAEADLVGQPGEVIFASHDDYVSLGPAVGRAFARGEPYTGEWRLLRANGQVFWARLLAQPVLPGDPGAGTIWCLYDIEAQIDDRNRLQHAATHDALTGLLNRKGFEHVMAEALESDAASSTLVMLDLDRFKPINDSFGHAAGDAMLKAVAQSLSRQIRASDHAGRVGGDEFAVLLRGCELARAVGIAEKIRQAVEAAAVAWDGRTLSVGASLGVCERATGHTDVAAWLKAADAACYEAKRGGRGQVCVARPALPVTSVEPAPAADAALPSLEVQ